MANKTQAKAAVDNAATFFKNDIDITLPVGVNIVDGKIEFNPTRGYLRAQATDLTQAESWVTTIEANLNIQARPFQTRREGNYVDSVREDVITIKTTAIVYQIIF